MQRGQSALSKISRVEEDTSEDDAEIYASYSSKAEPIDNT